MLKRYSPLLINKMMKFTQAIEGRANLKNLRRRPEKLWFKPPSCLQTQMLCCPLESDFVRNNEIKGASLVAHQQRIVL